MSRINRHIFQCWIKGRNNMPHILNLHSQKWHMILEFLVRSLKLRREAWRQERNV